MEQEEQEGDRGSIRTAVNLDFIKGRWYVKEEPFKAGEAVITPHVVHKGQKKALISDVAQATRTISDLFY